MSSEESESEKTYEPTFRRLRDARKKGDIPKSREVSSDLVLIGWLLAGSLLIAAVGDRLFDLARNSIDAMQYPFADVWLGIVFSALLLVVIATLLFVLFPVAIGNVTEFLQVGPIMTGEKLKPNFDKLNFVEGIKKMFKMDNLVEIVKAAFKAVLLVVIAMLVVRGMLAEIFHLVHLNAPALATALWKLTLHLGGWTVGVFLFIAGLDAAYQRYSYYKRMRMSHREIMRELKENEGDPHIKARRRQLASQWAQNPAEAAGNATAVIANPTHLAIALLYDPDEAPVPVITAKGQDIVALEMREAAEAAEVPILRDVELARTLFARTEEEDAVPEDLFGPVAEVIVWAREERMRRAEERARAAETAAGPAPAAS